MMGSVGWAVRRLAVLAPTTLLVTAYPADRLSAQSFFSSDSVLEATIRADWRAVLRDRDPESDVWREASIRIAGDSVARRVRLRTRGLYRLRECAFVPLRLRFAQDDVRGTMLDSLRRPKLVTHCEDNDEYEQNLLQEYAIYRIYQLLTPVSFQARLMRITYEDSAGQRRPITRHAILAEDPERLATRLGATLLETRNVGFIQTNQQNAALVSVFQYFIANTDWSLPGLHNIQLLRQGDEGVVMVPYDFDWAGVIDARYARPAAQLRIRSVRQRVWRGPCLSVQALEPALARFETLRGAITEVHARIPGLDPRIVERTRRYLDEFYEEIANRARFEQRIVRQDCIR
jgi:hypothetical protein